MRKNGWKAVLIMMGIIFFSACLLSVIYEKDNKYYQHQAKVANGVLTLEEEALAQHTLFSLVDNWMYYDHQIVTADTRESASLSGYTYLGQYPDFAMRDPDKSPYGVSTYRLQIKALDQPQTIAIYFPELDTSASVWLDDTLLFSLGDYTSDPMVSYIKNQTVSFEVTQDCDLYVIVGNDAHYYSGMYFPPILSTPQGIQNMLSSKLMFYGFFCFSAFTIALYSLNLWTRNRKDVIMLSLGIATLCFSLFLSKEFIKMAGIQQVSFFYSLQDTLYFIMLSAILRINVHLGELHHSRGYRWLMRPLTLLTILLSFTSFLYCSYASALGLTIYGKWIDTYKLVLGCYILYTTFMGLRKQQPFALLLLGANLFYMIGIFYTLIFANLFEPLVFGWPNEYFSFFIVVAFTILVFCRNNAMLKENEALTQHLSELVELKTNQLEKLLNERRVLLSEFAHDLKAPVSSMQNFIELIRHEDIQVDAEVADYLNIIERKSDELSKRMKLLQQFSTMDRVQQQKEIIPLQEFLTSFYQRNLPDTQAAGVYFYLHLSAQKAAIFADVQQFQSALENLFYNALSFTPPEGSITISLEIKEAATLTFTDTGCGIPIDQQERIFEKGISLRADSTQDRGLGLYITKSMIIELGGDISVISDGCHGSSFILTLPIEKKES